MARELTPLERREKKEKINTSLGWLAPLVRDRPAECIDMAINYLSGGTRRVLSGAIWSPIAAIRGGIHIRSVFAVVDALFETPDLLLKNEIFQDIATTEKLWQGVKERNDALATFISSKLGLPAEQTESVKHSISELLTDLAEKVPSNPEQIKNLLSQTSIILDPREEIAAEKTEAIFALTNELLGTEAFRELATAPQLWNIVAHKRKDIATLIAPLLEIPETKTHDFSQLLNVVGRAVPANAELVREMMEHTYTILTSEVAENRTTAILALTNGILGNEALREVVTSQELWRAIDSNEYVASLIAPLLEVPETKTHDFSQLLNVVGRAVPANAELVREMMEHTHTILTSEVAENRTTAILALTNGILGNEALREVVTSQELWNVMRSNEYVASLIAPLLEIPEAKTHDFSQLLNVVGRAVPANAGLVREMMEHTHTILTSDNVGDRTAAIFQLTNGILGNEALRQVVTSPQLWRTIESNEYVAGLIAPILGLPEEQLPAVTTLVSGLITAIAETMPAGRRSISKMMDHAQVLMDPRKNDETKMEHLFKLGDEAIEFIRKGNFLETLRSNRKTIEKMLTHYIPPWIVKETGITPEGLTNVLLNPKAIATLEKAYTQYRDSKSHSLGIIKAVTTVITDPSILKLLAKATVHVGIKKIFSIVKEIILAPRKFIVWLMTFVPDFMRRTHANEMINSILKNRVQPPPGETQNLFALCTPEKTELDPIISNTLEGCFKGLIIPHNLNSLTIDKFDFQRAILGEKGKPFSFAGSKISNTNFTRVKFKGNTIDLRGTEIDEKSLLTLLPLPEGKTILIDKTTKIITASKNSIKIQELQRKFTGLASEQIVTVPQRKKVFLHALKKRRLATRRTDNRSLRGHG